ncbi:MAG: hypothetical protein R3F65_21435 [bacterium]
MSPLSRLLPALWLLIALPALAAPGEVEKLRFESHPDRLDFYFTATGPIDGSLAEAIPARGGEVLILRLGGITATRRWVEIDDPAIARALLHPSTDRPPGAILRLRFVRGGLVRGDVIRQIKAEYVGDERTVLISVPRPAKAPKPKARKAAAPMRMPPAVLGPGETGDAPEPKQPEPKQPEPQQPEPQQPEPKQPEPQQPEPRQPEPRQPEPKQPEPQRSALPAASPTPTGQTDAPAAPATADVPAGVAGFVDRLELGADRPGIPRVALLPFTVLDARSRDAGFGEAAAALVGARLTARPGVVMVEADRFAAGLDTLHRDDSGRVGLDEARALAAMLGADTIIAGTIGHGPDGVVLAGRAIDAETGRDLGHAEQAFVTAALRETVEEIRDERTLGGAVLRSLVVPGWGQLYQGDTGRGVGYLTGFVAVLGAGIVSSVLGAAAEDDYNDNDPSTVGRRADADDHYARATALYIGAGAIWLASLVDAIATGEDRVRYVVPAPELR